MDKSSEKQSKVWGHGEFANMPQDIVRKTYPKVKGDRDRGMNDTISAIDGINTSSELKANRFLSNQK